MNDYSPIATPRTTTECPACNATIFVLTAPWCDCLAKKISLVCLACGVCFCKASDRVVREFWNVAPDQLVRRRAYEQKRRAASAARSLSPAADVLIVDDDEDMLFAAVYMVQQMGYTVAAASNAEDALATIPENAPRLVLTDALMPRMDGRQLCRCIKTMDARIKVVIMTSLYTAPRYKYEAYRQFKADEYLAKPIEFALLQTVLRRVMGEAEMAPLAVSA